ncbi:hypothetical protein [Paenibacillus kobensis]|uniref:hypothetical protein n=1 Tax=Paenibacillus kobensis TaxID=59841 RepID=UPI0013E2A2E1|nr:hypothetical protein [Paenibacillus kobensis]
MNRVLKWVLLICAASVVVNGLLYWGTGNRDVIINLCSSTGLGVLSAVWLLFLRKRQ